MLTSVIIIAVIATTLRLLYNYWFFIPPIIQSIRHPINPHHPVTWQPIQTSSSSSSNKRSVDQPPNLVLIVVDDMGFNDISLHGGFREIIKTPNIDSIGLNGVQFKNAYAGHATCAPCRAALLTGRHASNIGYEFTPADPTASWILGSVMGNGKLKGVYHSDHASSLNVSHMVLPRSEVLLSEVLQSNGYHTIQVGKWHLGSHEGYHPIDRGFNESLGFDIIASYLPYGSSEGVGCHFTDFFDKYLWASSRYEVKQNNGPSFNPKGYLTDYLAEEAGDAIKHFSSSSQPYFLYVGFTSMHTPLTALRSDYNQIIELERQRVQEYAQHGALSPPKPLSQCERVYAAMLLALDRAIGKILKAVRESSEEENTMIIFTNDNGAPPILSDLNYPYRGSKATFFEGGIRVPMLMKYPRKIQKRMIYEKMVSHIDIFDTMISAAGIQTSSSSSSTSSSLAAKRDGVDLLPYLLKQQQAEQAEEDKQKGISKKIDASAFHGPVTTSDSPHRLLFWRSGHYMALRNDNYKVQMSFNYHTNLTSYWMFDLEKDPYERKNLLLEDNNNNNNNNRVKSEGGSSIESKRNDEGVVFDLKLVENKHELFHIMLQLLHKQNSIHPVPLWPSLSETPVLIDKIFYDSYVEGDEYIYWPN